MVFNSHEASVNGTSHEYLKNDVFRGALRLVLTTDPDELYDDPAAERTSDHLDQIRQNLRDLREIHARHCTGGRRIVTRRFRGCVQRSWSPFLRVKVPLMEVPSSHVPHIIAFAGVFHQEQRCPPRGPVCRSMSSGAVRLAFDATITTADDVRRSRRCIELRVLGHHASLLEPAFSWAKRAFTRTAGSSSSTRTLARH